MSLPSTDEEAAALKRAIRRDQWAGDTPFEKPFGVEESRSSMKRRDMFVNELVNYCGVPLAPADAAEFTGLEDLEPDDRVLCFQVDDVAADMSSADIFKAWLRALGDDALPGSLVIGQRQFNCDYFKPVGDEWNLSAGRNRHLDNFLGRVWISEA